MGHDEDGLRNLTWKRQDFAWALWKVGHGTLAALTEEVLPLASGVRLLRIRNLRNIRAATVHLEPMTILVGPNGAGKSNVLAALQFMAAAMVLPLDQLSPP